MPRRKKPLEDYEPHTYSVWVDTVEEDGTVTSQIAYFGSSEYSARQALLKAILDNPQATRVDYRVDGKLQRRVDISHPDINWHGPQ